MWVEMQPDQTSERYDDCREKLLANLAADRTHIPVPPAPGSTRSSILLQGPPGSDVATRLQSAVRSSPRDLWEAVVDDYWKMDDEAARETNETADRHWNEFWERARERNEARERQS
jgi:hypothetical protein